MDRDLVAQHVPRRPGGSPSKRHQLTMLEVLEMESDTAKVQKMPRGLGKCRHCGQEFKCYSTWWGSNWGCGRNWLGSRVVRGAGRGSKFEHRLLAQGAPLIRSLANDLPASFAGGVMDIDSDQGRVTLGGKWRPRYVCAWPATRTPSPLPL